MIAVWIMLGLGLGAVALDLLGDDESSDDTPDDTPEDSDGELFFVDDGETVTGTDGTDLFTYDPSATGLAGATASGGAGDDVFIFDTGGLVLNSSALDGGTGNDLMRVNANASTISGGEGDDTIEGALTGGRVFGDAGDDQITIVTRGADNPELDGGLGNDTIDARGSNNIGLFGAEGDDLLITDGFGVGGAAYLITADGGEGDDTLRHEYSYSPPRVDAEPGVDLPAQLTGGSGADVFEIGLIAGNGGFTGNGSETVTETIAVVQDFAPGEDVLTIDLGGLGLGYTATEATLVENTADGTTTFQMTLTSATLPTQNLSVTMNNATGVSWDDVVFTNGTPPTLVPPAVV
ncbi:Hemolysin-type calcium-binding region [Candidatus Rhodobacter oscarellae]|uniref:Hemolysin-type calcium-binding region n=1 Tax=Candidatus Rhodobacter oscarellae TaxID=1675527 RepID=A0A0J9GRT5_9RHOB|nr:hypothetical protein [Candidatus Rhodobacter lobularis]KMW56188.1 Hemolysin-type calcium-binding region [Candidatus Rhodobacter lobularis]